jgi:cell division protein FtsL
VKVEIQTLSTRDRVETIASDNGLSLNQSNIITVTTSGSGE